MTKNERRLKELRRRARAGTITNAEAEEYKRLKFQELLAESRKIMG